LNISRIFKKALGSRKDVDTFSKKLPENLSLWYYVLHDIQALTGLVIILMFIAWSVIEGTLQILGIYLRNPALGWMLLPHNPLAAPDYALSLKPPSLSYIFGTNLEGEDIFSRILYAAPKDAMAAFIVVFIAIMVGGLLGTMAGYFGGWLDEALMRITDAFLAIPGLILAIALSILIGPGFYSVLIALTIVWWPIYARLFRGQTLTLKFRGFVEVSRLFGASHLKIIFKHIFPNAIDPIVAYAALDFGTVILTYSTLAFLGIGVQPPYPEWGSMASNGLSFFPGIWWYTFFPSATILLIVISFILLGDKLQDIISGRLTY
jgi:peptide/nickel transport system permease protein